jgi:hypothetical protein
MLKQNLVTEDVGFGCKRWSTIECLLVDERRQVCIRPQFHFPTGMQAFPGSTELLEISRHWARAEPYSMNDGGDFHPDLGDGRRRECLYELMQLNRSFTLKKREPKGGSRFPHRRPASGWEPTSTNCMDFC